MRNVIEATSILDYDDTDTVSSRRQTPVIPWQSQKQTITSDKPVDNPTEVVGCQVDEVSYDGAVERPSSPVPQNSKILHRTSTSIQLIEKKEIQNAAL
ncbi:hypothetical protein Btru_073135 [Bulinus truncatus]|nr:hypothetical protein Btru_073135 [Bulinus truncatus]